MNDNKFITSKNTFTITHDKIKKSEQLLHIEEIIKKRKLDSKNSK